MPVSGTVDEEVTSLCQKTLLEINEYDFEPARVVNLSLRSADNYLTLAKAKIMAYKPVWA